jgi:predicted Fe-Mo cluster-binding NifX family protein
MKMKIAVPTRGNVVDDHFGHCELYTIFTLDENRSVSGTEIIPSPQGCGCKSDIAAVLRQKGVNVMLAGNMGEGAFNILNYNGIEVLRGCSGDINRVVADFAQGRVSDSNESCRESHHHHGEGTGHQCNH